MMLGSDEPKAPSMRRELARFARGERDTVCAVVRNLQSAMPLVEGRHLRTFLDMGLVRPWTERSSAQPSRTRRCSVSAMFVSRAPTMATALSL